MNSETTFLVSGRAGTDGSGLKVTAFTSYGDRQASVSRDVEDPAILAEFGELAKRAQASVQEKLEDESFVAVSEAIVVAARRGEQVRKTVEKKAPTSKNEGEGE